VGDAATIVVEERRQIDSIMTGAHQVHQDWRDVALRFDITANRTVICKVRRSTESQKIGRETHFPPLGQV
jgi:hypothetical protein